MSADSKSQHLLSVMVVDDSAVYRKILTGVLEDIPGVHIVGTAANGRLALERMERLRPQAVLLDVEMPEMNGLETLEKIRSVFPTVGVVMISSMGKRAVDTTVAALEKGAIDFITKPDGESPEENHKTLVERLSPILWTFNTKRTLASVRQKHQHSYQSSVAHAPTTVSPTDVLKQPTKPPRSALMITAAPRPVAPPAIQKVEAVLIGVSTGGPNALGVVIPALPKDLGVPVLIVQHMPPVFTASLAKSLEKKSRLAVVEAEEGQIIEAGTVYIAPGGKHMVVRREKDGGRYAVGLNENPPENSCRPAVDVLFRSAAALYGGGTLSVIMTGMGQDGLNGVKALKQRGGRCLTQDEATCTIYGMPLAVDRAGLSDESLPLNLLADRIAKIVKDSRR